MSKRIRFSLIIAFFGVMLSYCLAGLYLWLANPGSSDGWQARTDNNEFRIVNVDPQGPAKELQPGDLVLAINGVRLSDDLRLMGFSNRMSPGTRYTVTVQRKEQELTFTLQTRYRPRAPFPKSNLVMLLFWVTGLFVFLLKPEDRQARLLALMLGSFAGLFSSGILPGLEALPDWLIWLNALARIVGLLSFSLPLHLFLFFPQPSPLLRRWPSLLKWLYVPHFMFLLPIFGVFRLPVEWSTPIMNWPPYRWLSGHGFLMAAFVSILVYLLGALVCLWLNYRTADVAGRRRLRVVMWGSLLGFGTLSLIIVMESLNLQERWQTIWNWLDFSIIFTLPLVPLSFAYAIVRHRVIPISLMLRRSARYLLVSRGSILLEIVAANLVVVALLTWLFERFRLSATLIAAVAGAASILAWRFMNNLRQRYLVPIIDRHFFRQAYDAQQILAELAESLRTTTDTQQLLELVADKVQAALQTESVAIFLRDEQTGDYRGAYACQYSSTATCQHNSTASRVVRGEEAIHLPHYAATLAQLAATGKPLELDGSDPAFDLAATNGHSQLSAEERQTLIETKTALLLPLKTKDELPGVLALGSRLGDLPFSGEDKRLLQSVAAAASLALENAQLVERMLAEARRRQEIEAENEQHAKELEGARRLQLSMLPKAVPQLPGWEIAALMQTATEVGGDYYDFYLSGDGTLTIAVGDATGHGLMAGTMVTATKSLFNHLAERSDVVGTLHDASRALKQMNLRSLFMALTLVKVQGNRLHCSVAGMPPILIYRAATQTVEELPLRGAPLGGPGNNAYREAEITLAPDDVALLMSDGLPERFNPAAEMFEYERTRESLRAHAHAVPRAIIEGLLKVNDEWAAGRPLDDDLTLVVLKRSPSTKPPI